jgi:hypothetical protein
VAARGHRLFGNQMPFLDQGLSANQMVEHFRLTTTADVPNAHGLRDWNLPELIYHGLPLLREIDADLPPKLLKHNLQFPLDPRKDDPVSSRCCGNSTFLGKLRNSRPMPPVLRRLGNLRGPIQPAILLNDILALSDFSTIAQSRKRAPVVYLPRPPPLAPKGRLMALAILLARPRTSRTSSGIWMQLGSVLPESTSTYFTKVLRIFII